MKNIFYRFSISTYQNVIIQKVIVCWNIYIFYYHIPTYETRRNNAIKFLILMYVYYLIIIDYWCSDKLYFKNYIYCSLNSR